MKSNDAVDFLEPRGASIFSSTRPSRRSGLRGGAGGTNPLNAMTPVSVSFGRDWPGEASSAHDDARPAARSHPDY